MDTLLYMLWAQKMSRTFTNFPKGNQDWTSLEVMEKAFFQNYPEHKEPYKKHKKADALKWGDLFGQDFQKLSLYRYLMLNFEKPTYDMV